MDNQLYVIGHRNPDTDSIISAIAYAYLKNQIQNVPAIATRCGEVNRETSYVLNYFGFEAPLLLEDVKPRAKDLLRHAPVSIKHDATVQMAGVLMRESGVKSLVVVDDADKLLGIFTVGDLARLLLDAWEEGSFPRQVPLDKIMRKENLVVFHDDDLIEEIRPTMIDTRYRNYPVVDTNNRFLGIVSRHSLLSLKGKKVILVDHNEISQAVPGIEQAEVVEIIDHHRIADMETSDPIAMRNEPVGSTATIVAKMFRENNVTPPPPLAGLMCAAILSDTLIFKSPTSTPIDQEVANQLAALAGINVEHLGREIFRAGAIIQDRTAADILFEDFKDFHLNNHVVGIGQIEIMDIDVIRPKFPDLLTTMQHVLQEKKYDLVLLMVTDLFRDGTELLFVAKQNRVMEMAFNVPFGANSIFLPRVMSRKKQVVPPLSRFYRS